MGINKMKKENWNAQNSLKTRPSQLTRETRPSKL